MSPVFFGQYRVKVGCAVEKLPPSSTSVEVHWLKKKGFRVQCCVPAVLIYCVLQWGRPPQCRGVDRSYVKVDVPVLCCIWLVGIAGGETDQVIAHVSRLQQLVSLWHLYVSEKVGQITSEGDVGVIPWEAVVVEESYGGFNCCLVLKGGRKVLCSY